MLIEQLILLGLLSLPVSTTQAAIERYGPLDKNYVMVDKEKWIVPFSFKPFGLNYETRVNKDIVLPLSFVMQELQIRGLTKEITVFQGCYEPRPVKGTDRPSIHAFGLGCDFNHTKFSAAFVEVWTRHGFHWGGNWCSWKDWMHFSYAWEKGECKYDRQTKESETTSGQVVRPRFE